MSSARRCPRCRTEYAEPTLLFCPSHGLRLGQEATSVLDPLLGRSLGKFAIQRRLGEGAMGVVYLAIQDVIERPVALKVLKPHLSRDPAMRALFVREVRLASRLRHESAVEVYDFGQDDEVAFFAMEYLSGETLAARLQRGPLPLREALDLWVKLLEVMSEAHESEITHCDLKPDNLFLEPLGERLRPKVLDFGIARLRQDEDGPQRRSNRSQLAGTPLYMAPEQLQGGVPNARWDVYALGLILFQMIVGRLPFEVGGASLDREQQTEIQGGEPALGLWDLAEQRLYRDAQRLGAACPQVGASSALEALIAAALDRDPLLRPASASALLVEVTRQAQREDWMVATRSWPQSALRRTGWRGGAAAVGAALTLLALAGGLARRSPPTAAVLVEGPPPLDPPPRAGSQPVIIPMVDKDMEAQPAGESQRTGQSAPPRARKRGGPAAAAGARPTERLEAPAPAPPPPPARAGDDLADFNLFRGNPKAPTGGTR